MKRTRSPGILHSTYGQVPCNKNTLMLIAYNNAFLVLQMTFFLGGGGRRQTDLMSFT